MHNYLSNFQLPALQLARIDIFSKLIGSAIIFVFLAPFVITGYEAMADDVNPGLYSQNSTPYGISFPVWTTKWWQWFIEIPNSQHPFTDITGERCGTNQAGPVSYLVGATGKAERTCTIQSDKAILFPILNTECSIPNPHP